ncbi:MAG: alpha/beta hydrolase [Alphaproteobacteria bacterium]|nr:alpha/beta hydrolase [Alphaproteobacteria bacterium]HCP01762.1 alpha/beta hydrolase [Rhodospirillaceae bacterium]
MIPASIQIVNAPDGTGLAYCATPAQAPEIETRINTAPGIVFLGGFMSDMNGKKATALEAWARTRSRGFLRFDYSGHGESEGAFRDGTIGRWRDDALTVIRHAGQTVSGLENQLVLVGSSMGAWIAILAARALNTEHSGPRVTGLVTIAAAPDFTDNLLPEWLGTEARKQIEETGTFATPSEYADTPYLITRSLLTEGRNHLVLRKPLDLDIPVRLIHGILDLDVPWIQSQKLMETLSSTDVELILVKDGDHRLSKPPDLDRMTEIVERLCDQLASRNAASPVR